MIYQANELQARLEILTLCGQDFFGELEWIGARSRWDRVEKHAEYLLSEFNLVNNF